MHANILLCYTRRVRQAKLSVRCLSVYVEHNFCTLCTHSILPTVPTQVQDAAKRACCARNQWRCWQQLASLHTSFTLTASWQIQFLCRHMIHCMQAKRRVYAVQSGSKGAAGKRKRADGATAHGASATLSCTFVHCFCESCLSSLSCKAGLGALQGPYNRLVCWY